MRLFVAIELSDAVREALQAVQGALGKVTEGVRWIPPEQLHLTVKFLGEVPDGDVPNVAQAVARSAARSRVFTMYLTECGCFPARGPVRIVWVGTHDPSGNLKECVNVVEEEMEGIGFPKESRLFAAHLTIGRVKEGRWADGVRPAVEAGRVKPARQSVDGLTLMSSLLSPQGPSYSVVSKAGLEKANPSSGRC